MTHLTVHEWGRVTVGDGGFTRHQANMLLAAARQHALGGVDGTNILSDHHGFLRARQIVGVIAATGCSLEILPKIDPEGVSEDAGSVRGRLIQMLDAAYGLELSVGETAAMAHRADMLLDIFITLFVDRLLVEVRRGLPRLYRTHEDDLRALRGQLDMVRQFTNRAVRPDRLSCRFDVLDTDVPLMQIMKACVVLVARHTRSANNQRKLAELQFLLADIRDLPASALQWDQVRIDRSSRRWRTLLDLARMLLSKRWQQTHAEARSPAGISLLFSMNQLFELYVALQLRRALPEPEIEVVAQGGFAYCLGPWKEGQSVVGDSHPTRPDILVKQRGHSTIVIDTKWKDLASGVGHADIYQMLAYSRLYACRRLILLYPAIPGHTSSIYTRGVPPGPERLDIATISLVGRPADIQADLRKLVVAGTR